MEVLLAVFRDADTAFHGLGVVLLLVAVIGRLETSLFRFDFSIGKRVGLVVVGLVALALPSLSANLGEPVPSPDAQVLATPTCEEYEVIADGERQPATAVSGRDFDLTGDATALPSGFSLELVWLRDPRSTVAWREYWPRGAASIANGRWSVSLPAKNAGAPGETQYYALFITGADGRHLLDSYDNLVRALAPNGDPSWPPLSVKTSDMVECGDIVLRFE